MRRAVLAFLVLAACGDGDGRRLPGTVELSYSFADGNAGFVAGFADVPPGVDGPWELLAEVRPLPAELGAAGAKGLYVQGNNHSDDLFMFIFRKVSGLRPDARYRLDIDIDYASNAPSGCAGVGGSPGDSVWLKAGAAPHEPRVAVPVGDEHLRVDVDKGDQGEGGRELGVVETIANGRPCTTGDVPYVALRGSHTLDEPVQTSGAGELWLVVGTDSGFEGRTGVYYRAIEVVLTPVSE
jgi:hypothetical protein